MSLPAARGFPTIIPTPTRELRQVLDEAARLDAVPVTTPKDAVRLPAALRAEVRVVGVAIAWEDPAAIEALLSSLF